VEFSDSVYVDLDDSGCNLVFSKRPSGTLIGDSHAGDEFAEEFNALRGAGVRSQQAAAAA